MWAVYAGPLKQGVRENPGDYYDRPFDVFVSYYDTRIYRLPAEWAKKHGPQTQMDWGSWLYICDRSGLWELMNPHGKVVHILPANAERKRAVRLPPTEAGEIPEGEWYGVLEAELY